MIKMVSSPEAQIFWFGHPAQAEALPASSLCVPGQSTIYYLIRTIAKLKLRKLTIIDEKNTYD